MTTSSEYLWFYQYLNATKNNIKTYLENVIEMKKRLEKRKREYDAEQKRLQNQASEGMNIDSYIYERQQKALETIHVDQSRLNYNKRELEYDLQIGFNKLFKGFFPLFHKDVNALVISKSEYHQYLKSFNEIIKMCSGLDLECCNNIPSALLHRSCKITK